MHLRYDDKQVIAAGVNGILAAVMLHFWHTTQDFPFALAAIFCAATSIGYAIVYLGRFLP